MAPIADTPRRPARRLGASWARLDPSWRWALRLHAGFLLLFTAWTAWTSSAHPTYIEEARVPLWPLTAPLGTWLERVVLLPLYRYDVVWYVGIAREGYAFHSGATAFHPLYPLLISLLGQVVGNYLLAGWLISQLCCVGMLVLLHRLVALDHDVQVADRTTLFLMASPLGFSFLMPYNESLLLLCIVGALYAARRGRWWLAGLCGAGAVLTKLPGAAVALPLLWMLWQQRRAGLGARDLARALAGVLLIPAGLLGWLGYRATLGDVSVSLSSPASVLNALLVTPSYQDVWDHHFTWPWEVLRFALERLESKPTLYLILSLFLMLFMVMLTLYSVIRLRPSYAAYSLALTAMNLSILFPMWPYISIIRRFTIVFPLFIALALLARRPAAVAAVLLFMVPLWVLISSMVVRGSFIP